MVRVEPIVGKMVDYTVAPIVRHVGYMMYYNKNIRTLLIHVDKLKAFRDEVQNEVSSAEERGEQINHVVVLWLNEVDKISSIADELLNKEEQANLECLHGVWPSLSIRHQLSRKSTELVPRVLELYEEGLFSNISYKAKELGKKSGSSPHPDFQAFDSRSLMIKRILNELSGPDTNKIGVYGIGGVGKTTLVDDVVRQVSGNELFEDVVILQDVHRRQRRFSSIVIEILEQLGLEFDENDTLSIVACKIGDRLKNKKALIVIDDVRESIDLEELGIPSVATCKVLLTSRYRGLLIQMGSEVNFGIHELDENESWSLFERRAGDVVQDPDIRIVAREVAKRCGGFPLLIVSVATGLQERTMVEWQDALRHLQKFNKDELCEVAYKAIEWSYDQLSEKLIRLFFLCTVIAWKNSISLNDLFKYALGWHVIGIKDTLEDAQTKLRSSVFKLEGFSLLLADWNSGYVKMPDLFVQNFAFQEASRKRPILLVADGDELEEWPDKDFFARCRYISLRSSKIPVLPQDLECNDLLIFYLKCEEGSSIQIPSNFFDKMRNLELLSIQNLHTLSPLPSLECWSLETLCLDKCMVGDIAQIGELRNLVVLSFVNSNIQQLPGKIGQLTRLRLLDLTDCFDLKLISPNVISRLTRLEDLRMRNVLLEWEADDGGVRSNACLSELKHLPLLTALEIEIPDSDVLPKDLFFSLKLQRYHIRIGSNRRRSPVMEEETTNNALHLDFIPGSIWDRELKSLAGLECLSQFDNDDLPYAVVTKVMLLNLTTLVIHRCNGLKFICLSSTARRFMKLKHLEITECEMMEEIVSTEQDGKENTEDMFPLLQYLKLKGLPRLAKFCSRSCIEFPNLANLQLETCNKLESFICNPMSKSSGNESHETVAPRSLFDRKVDFPNLETLTWDGMGGLPRPSKTFIVLITKSLFPQLKDLTLKPSIIWYGPPTPAEFHEKSVLPANTEMPENITTLRLHGMEKLTRLWKEDTAPAGQVFTKLDTLEVKFCSLNNRELSAISFQKLTGLEITFCWRLQYLMTYSVAQSLVQLKRLIVDECQMMKEILADDKTGEDVEDGEVVFGNLQQLKLIDLINLERFCSGKYTVKVPCLSGDTLVVNGCRLSLKITGGVLEEVSDNEAVSTLESASSRNASEVVEIHDDRILSERSDNKHALLIDTPEREQEVSELPLDSGGDASEGATATALATAPCTQVIEASSEGNIRLEVPSEAIKVSSSVHKLKGSETEPELFISAQPSQSSQETETAKDVISRLTESSVDLLESTEAQYQFKEALGILVTQEVIPSAIQTRVITYLKEIKEAKEACALATAKLVALNEHIRKETWSHQN